MNKEWIKKIENSFKTYKNDLESKFLKAVELIRKDMEAQLKKYGMMKDGHTLKKLRKLGHPYSKRKWGEDGSPELLQHDIINVHKQSGELSKEIGTNVKKSMGEIFVQGGFKSFSGNFRDKAMKVLFGSSTMVGRNFFDYILNDRKDHWVEIVKRTLRGD